MLAKGSVLVGALCLLVACNDPLDNEGSMLCMARSTYFSAKTGVLANYENDVLTVTGLGTEDRQCQFIVSDCTEIGEYLIGEGKSESNRARWAHSDTVFTATYQSGYGTVLVDVLNEREVSGSFYFKAISSHGTEVLVENGSFRVALK